MKNNYLLKRKALFFAKVLGILLLKGIVAFFRIVFAKRTILFVTKQKIRSITLGPVLQLSLILGIFWVGNVFIQSLQYSEIISEKSEEISRLRSVNRYFEEEFSNVNEKLKKVSEYLTSITGNRQNVKASQEQEFKQPAIPEDKNLSKEDQRTFNQIRSVDSQIDNIQSIAQFRIKKIEEAITITGLNIKKIPTNKLQKKFSDGMKEVSLNEPRDAFKGQGGPLTEEDNTLESASNSIVSEESLEKHLKKVKFTNEFDYLIVLERLINVMPFAKPMKNYYISSGFGTRVDPITRRFASHRGLDFVGVVKEKILSPSEGKVILAGKFSDYGNAIVIDHGFGITTRYGHLNSIKVKEGQLVKRGEVIATQGSTGRSTGPHLHYEVRYKNVPLNPRKFLEAGEHMFNDKTGFTYVNS